MTTPALNKTLQTGKSLVDRYGKETLAEWEEQLKAYAKGTQQYYLYCVSAYMKHEKGESANQKAIFARSIQLKKELEQEAREQKKNPRQETNWLEWPEVLEVREKYKADSLKSYRDNMLYLTLCLYTYIPPLRLDWTPVSVEFSKEGNCLDLKAKKFYLREYKTAGTHGELKIDIPAVLLSIIEESLEKYPRKWLLSQIHNAEKPLSPANLSIYIRECFEDSTKKIVSVQLLRRIWATHTQQNEPSLIEREKQALALGHSVYQHNLYRKIK